MYFVLVVLLIPLPVQLVNADAQDSEADVAALVERYGASLVGPIPEGLDLAEVERALAEMAQMRQADESGAASSQLVFYEKSQPSHTRGAGTRSASKTVTVGCKKVHEYGPASKMQIIVTADAKLHRPSNHFYSIASPLKGISGAWVTPFMIEISDVRDMRSWIDDNGNRANVEAYYNVTTNFLGAIENTWTALCRGRKHV